MVLPKTIKLIVLSLWERENSKIVQTNVDSFDSKTLHGSYEFVILLKRLVATTIMIPPVKQLQFN